MRSNEPFRLEHRSLAFSQAFVERVTANLDDPAILLLAQKGFHGRRAFRQADRRGWTMSIVEGIALLPFFFVIVGLAIALYLKGRR